MNQLQQVDTDIVLDTNLPEFYNQIAERSEVEESMEDTVLEETLPNGSPIEPQLVSIQKHEKDGSVTAIAVPQTIQLPTRQVKKHSGIKKQQFVEIWNSEKVRTLKDFTNITGLTENNSRVRAFQYKQAGEMLKQLDKPSSQATIQQV